MSKEKNMTDRQKGKLSFPKGSMGAADQKSEKIFLLGATVIVLIIFSMVYLNFPHTFLNDWHKNAGSFWKVTGVIPFAGCIYFMIVGKNISWSETGAKNYGKIAVGLLVLGILMGCGWNFDLL